MTMQDSISAARISGPVHWLMGRSAFEFNFSREPMPVFAGHFPGHPILPGIFQLEIVRLAGGMVARQNRALSISEIVKTKFQRPILPGETLKLSLKLTDENGGVSARANFTCGGQPAGEAYLKLS
jgi:3-hydroxyacyl-[acyl-carrier-protein] dehydratase